MKTDSLTSEELKSLIEKGKGITLKLDEYHDLESRQAAKLIADNFLSLLVEGCSATATMDMETEEAARLNKNNPGIFDGYPWVQDLIDAGPQWTRIFDQLKPFFGSSSYGDLIDELNNLKTGENWHGLEFRSLQDGRIHVNILECRGSRREYIRSFIEGCVNHKLARNPSGYAKGGYVNLSKVKKFEDIQEEKLTDYSFRVVMV